MQKRSRVEKNSVHSSKKIKVEKKNLFYFAKKYEKIKQNKTSTPSSLPRKDHQKQYNPNELDFPKTPEQPLPPTSHPLFPTPLPKFS